jgi:hypothetical protein
MSAFAAEYVRVVAMCRRADKLGQRLAWRHGRGAARPGKTMLSLTGDGGLNMMLRAIETARRLGLTLLRRVVRQFIFENRELI